MSDTRTTSRRRKFSVDALFTDTSARAVGVSELVEAKLIRIDRIEPDPDQPRKEFDTGALDELASSIRLDGVLQPVAVRYDSERDIYVLLHGERRWRAARIAGLETIPAVVRDVPHDRRLIQQLIENVVREDLNALDRAAALRAVKVQMGDVPWERVAETVGIRRSRLFQLLGTEKLSDTLQEALRRGLVSEKQTRSVQGLPAELQTEIGNRVLAGTLEGRALGEAARQIGSAVGNPHTLTRTDTPAVLTIRKHARSLARSLDALDSAEFESLDVGHRQDLRSELQRLSERLDAIVSEL